MLKTVGSKILLVSVCFAMLLILGTILPVYADPSDSMISGRLAATYDNKSGTVTAMVAGYCEGKPVTVGPMTWTATEKEFSLLTAEDVGKNLCGENLALKKVTKSAHNGKDIVADVIILRLD